MHGCAHPSSTGFMAASSGDDIPAQLAALLGREMVQIRKTADDPPRVSVIDVVQAISGMTKSNAGHYVDRLKEAHPEVCADCTSCTRRAQCVDLRFSCSRAVERDHATT